MSGDVQISNGEQSNSSRYVGSADSEPLWLFIHIPKTAGSSFRTALAEQLKPEHNIHADRSSGKKRRNVAFAEAVDEFLALDADRKFAFASGHINMAEGQRIRESLKRPIRFLTMLRNPVTRVISDYRYQCTPAHPTHEMFKAEFPTLESFVESRRSQNKMFRYLALPGETLATAIERIEREFSFVGVVEMYAQSVRQCRTLVGRSFSVGTRLNVTNASHQDVVPDELLIRIRHLNQWDERLWQHFHKKLDPTQQFKY